MSLTVPPSRTATAAQLGANLDHPSDPTSHRLHCVQRQHITHDVATFVFELDTAAWPRHDAGQYLTLTVDIDSEQLERCYTISSPPTRPHRLAITVKREPEGRVSNWLHDHLWPGGVLSARGPFGGFCPDRHRDSARFLFLSGGSGATPLMSALRAWTDLGEPVDVAYVHSARTPRDILFRSELDALRSTTPSRPELAVHYVCEHHQPGTTCTGPTGRLDARLLARLVPDLAQRQIFMCGPAPYLRAARQIVTTLGVPEHHIHEEAFANDPASTIAAPATGSPPSSPTVTFQRSSRSAACAPGATLLDTAAAAGVAIPSACRAGMCGTCKVTKVSGEVLMAHQGGIRPKEIAAGKILACCAQPTSDVVIDL